MNLSKNDTMSLPEELQSEIERCQELLKFYARLGPQGAFGFSVLSENVRQAKIALAEGDAAAMVVALRDLKGCE